MLPVRLEHAPSGQVADPFRLSVDDPRRIERQVNADYTVALLEQEAVVGLVLRPRRRHGPCPRFPAAAVLEVGAQELGRARNVRVGDRA